MIPKLPQNGFWNFPDYPGVRPHSDPEGHTVAPDRPRSSPEIDKGSLGEPGEPKGVPKTPKKAPKVPSNEFQATPSAALRSPNAPKRYLTRRPPVPALEKKNLAILDQSINQAIHPTQNEF